MNFKSQLKYKLHEDEDFLLFTVLPQVILCIYKICIGLPWWLRG